MICPTTFLLTPDFSSMSLFVYPRASRTASSMSDLQTRNFLDFGVAFVCIFVCGFFVFDFFVCGLGPFLVLTPIFAPQCVIALAPHLLVGTSRVGRLIRQYTRRGGAPAIACRRIILANCIYFLSD